MTTNKYWMNYRIVTMGVLFAVLFTVLLLRAIQLQILTDEFAKIARQQLEKANDTKVLIRELQKDIDKFNSLSPSYDILDKNKMGAADNLLFMKREKLLKEVTELTAQHEKLSKDLLSLQNSLKNLSMVEENSVERIIDAYERMHNRSKWYDFSLNFLMGVLTSILGAMLYKYLAERFNLPLIDIYGRTIGRILPLITSKKTQR